MPYTKRRREESSRTRKILFKYSGGTAEEPPPLSQQNIRLLKDSWDSICTIALSSQSSSFTTKKITENEIKHVRRATMYQYIPAKIRDCVETTKWVGYIHEGILQGGRKVRIFLTVPKGTKSSSQLRVYLHYVTVWLQFASTIAKSQCAEELSVYLLLTDSKKRIPSDDDELVDTVHANTAFTTSCSKQNEIFLYRREEWFKVFIHESFHCLGLDFSSKYDSTTNQCILSHFPAVDPRTDIRLYETFCETWAELFHLLFRLFTLKTSETRRRTDFGGGGDGNPPFSGVICRPFSEKRFIRALRREQTFSLNQSNKILRLADLNYSDLFSKKDERRMYREKTQAFSYYVLKSACMWNINEYMNWCGKYCEGYPAPIQFIESNAGKYCELISQLAKTAQYREVHEKIGDKDATTTLRMTSQSVEW
jgi:hypothetical protein